MFPNSPNMMPSPAPVSREAILQFLLNPKSYPHKVVLEPGAASPRHIETHISDVFLTGDFAYKIKRPLKYDFLDFSTLEQRRIACERELALNRRFAPAIYLEVVAITRDGDRLQIGGTGEVVEYAVKMKQFDNRQLFSELLKSNQLQPEQIVGLTKEVVRFHRQAELRPGAWGFEVVKRLVTENIDAIAEFGQEQGSKEKAVLLRALCDLALERHYELISERSQTKVRALHGDLHLRNVVMIDGQPTMFDGIEFNDEYSNIDPWADIGFLIMDLNSAGRRDLATYALNSYLDQTDDYAGLELLPLYMSYRAAVRAKVAGLRARSSGESAAVNPEFLRYRELALKLIDPANCHVICVGGFSGTGKSTLAAGLAPVLGAIHLRTDVVRRHVFGLAEGQSAPKEIYSDQNINLVYDEVLKRARHAAAAGFPVVIDAVFGDRQQREDAEGIVKAFEKDRQKIAFTGIWCEVPREVAIERIRKRSATRQDPSEATEAVLDLQLARGAGEMAWRRLDSSAEPSKVLKDCIEILTS